MDNCGPNRVVRINLAEVTRLSNSLHHAAKCVLANRGICKPHLFRFGHLLLRLLEEGFLARVKVLEEELDCKHLIPISYPTGDGWVSTVFNTTGVILGCPVNINLDELVSVFIQLDLQIVLPQASLQFTTSKAKVEGHKEPDLHYQHLWLLVSQEDVHHLFKILHCDDRLMRHCLELTIPLMLLDDAIQCVVCTCKFNVIYDVPLAFIQSGVLVPLADKACYSAGKRRRHADVLLRIAVKVRSKARPYRRFDSSDESLVCQQTGERHATSHSWLPLSPAELSVPAITWSTSLSQTPAKRLACGSIMKKKA